MKITSKSFLVFLNLLGSMITISSSSWFPIWIGIELTSMTAPSLMAYFDSSLVSKINSWKYFMIQCYASSLFFLSIMCMSFSSAKSSYSTMLWILVIMSMIVKMGIIPFHGWFYHISISIPWTTFLILSTIQKIGPLVVISESFNSMSNSIQINLLVGMLVSTLSLSGLIINFTRYFMITSSMINSAWLISSAQISKFSFIAFMSFYFFHLLILFMEFNSENSNLLESMYFNSKKSFPIEIYKISVIMSLIGMPPLMGFFMKVAIIEQLIVLNQYFSAVFLSLSSSVMMLMYMKLVLTSICNSRMDMFQFNKYSFFLPAQFLILSMSSMYYLI